MSRLRIKPHWWLEIYEEIPIIGHKLPFGIQAEVIYKGMKYSGVLYPVEIVES
jgi:hypothetical protein